MDVTITMMNVYYQILFDVVIYCTCQLLAKKVMNVVKMEFNLTMVVFA